MKRILMLTTALVLGGLVLRRSSKETQRLQATSEQLNGQILTASNRLDGAQIRADSLRKNLGQQTIESDSTVSELAEMGRRRSQSSASEELADAHPPAELPAWAPDSPHVWVDKRLFQRLYLHVFLPDGSLTPIATEILALDELKANQLSETLRRIVSDHRSQETIRARLVQEHLPDIAQTEGEKFTFRVDPPTESSTNLKAEFETILKENLGTQRCQLIAGSISNGMSEIFGVQESRGRITSFVRLPDGQFRMAEEGGRIPWATGPLDIRSFVPKHLHSLIPADFLRNPAKPPEP